MPQREAWIAWYLPICCWLERQFCGWTLEEMYEIRIVHIMRDANWPQCELNDIDNLEAVLWRKPVRAGFERSTDKRL